MDLDKLTEQELRYLAKKIEENKKVDTKVDLISTYVPHTTQEAFHKSDKQIRLLQGGNRSGKSTAGVIEDVWWALGEHPYFEINTPVRGRIVSTDFPHGIKEVIIPKLEEWVPRRHIKRWHKNNQGDICGIEFKNGSYVDFMAYTQDFIKFAGVALDFVHFDEPPKQDIYEENMLRLVDRAGCAWLTMTPLKEPWIYERLWKPGLEGSEIIDCFSMNTHDNPHLPPEAIRSIELSIAPEEREARLKGQYRHLQGRIYDDFDRAYHVVEPFRIPSSWKWYEVIDPHPKKPHVVIFAALAPDNTLYVVSEMELKGDMIVLGREILKRRKKAPQLIVADVSTMLKESNFSPINPRKQLSDLIGPFIPAEKNPDDGINMVRARLRATIDLYTGVSSPHDTWNNRGIKIFSNCKKTIAQLQDYIWDDGAQRGRRDRADGKAKPLKRNDDYADCIRYLCSVDPTFTNKAHPVRLSNLNRIGKKDKQ